MMRMITITKAATLHLCYLALVPELPPPPTQRAHQHAQRQLLRLHKVQRKVSVCSTAVPGRRDSR